MRLLLVEDHPDTREIFAHLLRRHGHQVEAVATLAEARRVLAAAPRPDAAVVDRALPDGDGCELGPALRALGVPGVVVSALAYEADEVCSLAAGFSAHLAKPVTVDEVLAAAAAADRPAG